MANEKTLNVKQMDFDALNVEQLKDASKGFLDVYQRASLEEKLNKKTGGPKTYVKENPHPEEFEKDKGQPPKQQDIIEAMFENILIQYTYDGCEWLYNAGRYQAYKARLAYKEFQGNNALKKEAFMNDETHKFCDKVIDMNVKAFEKIEKFTENFDGFSEMGKLIREGKVNEISDERLPPKTKKFINDMPEAYRKETFSKEQMEKATKVLKNHIDSSQTFARQIAGVQVMEWKLLNKDDPKTKKSEEELKALYDEQYKAALAVFNRHVNNELILGRDPGKAGTKLCELSNNAVLSNMDALNSGYYNEHKGKDKEIKPNSHLGAIKELTQATQNEVGLLNKEKVDLLEASNDYKFRDNIIKTSVNYFANEDNVKNAKRENIQSKKNVIKKILNRIKGNNNNDNNNNDRRREDGRD